MNRFLTHTGRQPIWLDDIDFLQTAVADEFKKLILGLTGMDGGVVILTGCQKSILPDGTVRFSSGVIAYDGEILYVNACSFPSDNGFRFAVKSLTDSSGDRTLLDSGEEVECYQERTAFIDVPFQASHKIDTRPIVSNCRRLEDILRERASEKVVTAGEITNGNGTSAYYKLVRFGSTYQLSLQFSGAFPVFEIPIDDGQTISDIFVPYEVARMEDKLYRSGMTHTSAGYVYQNHANTGYDLGLAKISARLDKGYQSGPAVLRVSIESNQLSQLDASAGDRADGGFTVNIVERDYL